MKQTLVNYGIPTLLFVAGYTGAIWLRNVYADEASSGTLTTLLGLWVAFVIAGYLAIQFGVMNNRAQKHAEAATAAHGNSTMVNLYVRMLFTICFGTSKPVGFYLNWTEEFLRANGGYEGLLKCMRTGTTPHILDIGAEPLAMSVDQHEEIAGAVKMMRHQVV